MKRLLPAAITAVIALLVQAPLSHASDEAQDSSEGVYVSLSDLEDETTSASEVTEDDAGDVEDASTVEDVLTREAETPSPTESPAVKTADEQQTETPAVEPDADSKAAESEQPSPSDVVRPASSLEIPPPRPGRGLEILEARPKVTVYPVSLPEDDELPVAPPEHLEEEFQLSSLQLSVAQAEPLADSSMLVLPDGDAVMGCDDTTCETHCLDNCPLCCGPAQHLTSFYAEALYLRARNAEVVYAVPADGPVAGGQPVPIQVGSLGILDPDYDMGVRLGVNIALDTVSSFDVRYTLFESNTSDEIAAQPSLFLRSQLTHPSVPSASVDALAGSGTLDINFDTLDLTYRSLKNCCDVFSWNYVVGARYARLEQQFAAQFIKNGTESISSDIDFDGGGLRVGLEGLRHSCRNRLQLYASGYANLVAGRFRARHFQGHSFDTEVVDVEWEAGRVVPILDMECGVGWTSCDCRLRMTAGYQVSAWFNTVRTQDFAQAVQTNEYLNLSETMTFDGLQARVELRF